MVVKLPNMESHLNFNVVRFDTGRSLIRKAASAAEAEALVVVNPYERNRAHMGDVAPTFSAQRTITLVLDQLTMYDLEKRR